MNEEEMEAEGRNAYEDEIAEHVQQIQKYLEGKGYSENEILDALAKDYRIPNAERYIVR
jgi:hypothetical protein